MMADAAAESVNVVPSSIDAAAVGRELGDLFEYRIAQPVTIRKNESAMLPFLQQTIEGRKLLIYSDHSSQHPTNAAELTNSSGKTLDGGPITVYDAGAYAGEALMETLKASDKRLISYAVDLGTRITEAFGSKGDLVREIHASRGIVTTKICRRGDPHLHRAQRGSEGQDPDHRAPAAPRLYAAQPEAEGKDRHQLPLRIAARPPARPRSSWSTKSASTSSPWR